MATSNLDLVLFGATGFTGKLALEYIINQYIKSKGSQEVDSFNFGIAARNKAKLEKVLNDFKQSSKYEDIGEEIDRRITLIECDCFKIESVEAMIKQTRVIVTTVGPYAKFGENIIAVCCKYGVDYVDLTGEFVWVKRMMNKYGDDAKESNARIINFGGCVAALTDCAIYAAVKRLKEQSKDKSIIIKSIKPGIHVGNGAGSSGGTIASWLHSMSDGVALSNMNNAYFLCDKDNDYEWQKKYSQPSYKMIEAEYNSDIKMYGVPFMYGPVDRMVFLRSNELTNYFYGPKVKIHQNKMYLGNRFLSWIFSFLFFIFPHLLRWTLIRKALIMLVQSLAFKPGNGPNMEAMKASKWRELIYVNAEDKVKKKEVVCKVDIGIFGDYGYLNTAKLLVEQGILCALDRKKKNKKYGGFLTPAACFGDKLPKRLNDTVNEFEISYKIQ